MSSLLVAGNPNTFRAYFRGYPSANRYWDAPDGLRYWRGRFEIDRGQPDEAGLRRVDAGGTAVKDWEGPPFAPDAIGLYERDERGGWWPTEAALEAGYQPCRSCELTSKKAAVVAAPKDPARAAEFIAVANARSRAEKGRSLTRDELAQFLRHQPDRLREPSSTGQNEQMVVVANPLDRPVDKLTAVLSRTGSVSKSHVVRKLLELRAREAPLGSSAYRGVLTQKAIAEIADVPVRQVTKAAMELDQGLASPTQPVE